MDQKKKKKLVVNIILFLAIMGLTFWFVFRDEEFSEVQAAMHRMATGPLVLAIAMAVLFVSAEGIMMWYLLRSFGSVSSLLSCLCCAFIGFFFSGITPSATGGQPMQLYYLKKDGNSWSFASVALMMLAFMYKLVLVLFGLGILIFWNGPLRGWLGTWYYRLFLLGLVLNGLLVVGLLMVMLTPSVVRLFLGKVEWLAVKLHLLSSTGSRKERLDHFMDNYQSALSFFKLHKKNLVVVLLGTVLQRATVFALSVPDDDHVAAGGCLYRSRYAAGTRCTGNYRGDVPACVPWYFYGAGCDSFDVYYKRRELLPDADHWIGDYNLSVFHKKTCTPLKGRACFGLLQNI